MTIKQDIINKINAQQDFTFNLKNKSFKLDREHNYIVGTKNIYTGKNPSLDFELILKVDLNNKLYCNIGGWFDKDTNTYYVDYSYNLHTLQSALNLAKIYNQKSIFDIKNNTVIYL
jgi:hypothetical protein